MSQAAVSKSDSDHHQNNDAVRAGYNAFLHAIDVHVGQRLKMRRLLLGMTQNQLGEAAGLVFQQIQKYERGANRIGAGRLYQFARLLCVDITWFYKDMPDDLREGGGMRGFGSGEQAELHGVPGEIAFDSDAFDLIQAYRKISDPRQRESVKALIASLSSQPPKRGAKARK